MEPAEFAKMIVDVREAVKICGRVNYELSETEKSSTVFRRSLFAVKDIKRGEPFTKENIRCIRPGYGIAPKYYDNLLRNLSKHEYKKGQPISEREHD
jgi:sialic acid synthase SpsE